MKTEQEPKRTTRRGEQDLSAPDHQSTSVSTIRDQLSPETLDTLRQIARLIGRQLAREHP